MTARLADTPVLTTERLTLRAPRAGDLAPLAAFTASDRSRYLGGPSARPRAHWNVLAQVTGHWALHGFGMFVLEPHGTDRGIGIAGPWFPGGWPEREIGWTMWDDAHEGAGLMREAAEALLDHAFGTLGWDTAVSYIDPDNARSIALAERLGAVRDDRAEVPDLEGAPCHVYRHPRRDGTGA
ncbi:MAG: GNAT family N-acetyltransferase [Paracoccaceae bacterium]